MLDFAFINQPLRTSVDLVGADKYTALPEAQKLPGTLWLERLSITTMSPGHSTGARCCSTHDVRSANYSLALVTRDEQQWR
jgi:hypothetical protein